MENNHDKDLFFTHDIQPISRSQIKKYAGASGGSNPIHFDEEVGKRAGFNGVIAQGMLVMGIVSRIIYHHIPLLSLVDFSSKFVGVVEPGEELKMKCYTNYKDKNHDNCSYTVYNSMGDKKIIGSFTYKI